MTFLYAHRFLDSIVNSIIEHSGRARRSAAVKIIVSFDRRTHRSTKRAIGHPVGEGWKVLKGERRRKIIKGKILKVNERILTLAEINFIRLDFVEELNWERSTSSARRIDGILFVRTWINAPIYDM